MYDIANLYMASSVDDAVRALKEDDKAILVSGGTDVLIKVREGRLSGTHLVSIHGIKKLKGITLEEDGTIVIGPATAFSHVTNHPVIKKHLPFLGEAADTVGGPQIRNMGTIGGNICNGVTSADTASTLKALNARLVLKGSEGVRQISIHDFYTGPGKTIREHTEVLTEIRISKADYENMSGQYIKYGKRNAMEIATLGCCVLVRLSKDKKSAEDIRIAFGVAAPTPIRCFKTEEKVRGMAVGEELYKTVENGVLEEVNPRSSWRASKTFRIQLVKTLGVRALKMAVRNGGGEADLETWMNGGGLDA